MLSSPETESAAQGDRLRAALFPGFGVATLLLLPVLAELVSPNHLLIYHLAAPVSVLIVPALFNLLILTLLVTVYLGVPKDRTRLQRVCWTSIIAFLPWIAARNLSLLYDWHLPRLSLVLFVLGSIAVLIAGCLRTQRHSPLHSFKVVLVPLHVLAILGCILVAQVLWFGWQGRHLNDPQISAALSVKSAPHSRILWIVFDELSYEQVFDARPSGLTLPNFDAFAAEATVFAHAVPAGAQTDVVLPSLLTGLTADKVRSSAAGSLDLHTTASPHWQPFQASQTVFADALSLGYRTATVGWYNPYCRILSGVLQRCFWANQALFNVTLPAQTIHENLFHPFVHMIYQVMALFSHTAPRDQTIYPVSHVNDYESLYRAADDVLADTSLNFVLIHLPIPHPGGIYDRHRNTLTTAPGSTYIDNLALADAYMAHLRQVLERQRQWDDSTVLIMGDHSWRTYIWSSQQDWTEDEKNASHGGSFDERPFYALKLPHQQSSAQVLAPFPAVETRVLLDNLLTGRLQTSQQIETWIAQPH